MRRRTETASEPGLACGDEAAMVARTERCGFKGARVPNEQVGECVEGVVEVTRATKVRRG